jgi:hypothetical protein
MISISQRRASGYLTIIVAEAGKRTPYSMTTQTTNADICSVCEEPVKGDFEVFSYSRLGVPVVEVESTPDRNFNVCDWCNKTVCFRCSDHPDSGFCNDCYRIMSVSIDDDKEINRALTTTTMDQEPKIIYEEPQGSDVSANGQAKRVSRLITQREVDIADFQGRIETLTEKLHEVVNEFAEYVRDIDAAIMETMTVLQSKTGPESADHFGNTN